MSTTTVIPLDRRSSSTAGLASLREGVAFPGTNPPSLMDAAARRRIQSLIELHGAESRQVSEALLRWAGILAAYQPLAAVAGPDPESYEAVLAAVADEVDDHGAADGVITTPQWTVACEPACEPNGHGSARFTCEVCGQERSTLADRGPHHGRVCTPCHARDPHPVDRWTAPGDEQVVTEQSLTFASVRRFPARRPSYSGSPR